MNSFTPTKPCADLYQSERWIYFRQSENKILILKESDQIDFYVQRGGGVPWGLIVCEIPIHYWLTKTNYFKPDLERQLMNASLIAMAPQLLTINENLNSQIDLLEAENELLKQIIQRLQSNKTGPGAKISG